METVRSALVEAATTLGDVSDTPRLDAELLMGHALGVARDRLILNHLDDAVPPGFAGLLARRLAYEPVAYIIGYRDFWTIRLAVGPGVLIPRPDSEVLIEAALAHCEGPRRILDLGTGPGTLLLAALSLWPQAQGLGIDASDGALDYARRNARELGLVDRAQFQLGDWADGVEGPFDLILCNPPYVETTADLDRQVHDFEPSAALFAGRDGLDDYRRVAPQLPRLIADGGCAVLEIGHMQAAAVTALLQAEGLKIAVRKDLAGRDRAVLAMK